MDKIITLDLLKLFKEKYDETLPSILERVLTAEEEEEVSYGLEILKSEDLIAAEEAGAVSVRLIYAPKVVGDYSENLENTISNMDWDSEKAIMFMACLESLEKIEGQSPLVVVRYIFSSDYAGFPILIADDATWSDFKGPAAWTDSEGNRIQDVIWKVTDFKDWSTITLSVEEGLAPIRPPVEESLKE